MLGLDFRQVELAGDEIAGEEVRSAVHDADVRDPLVVSLDGRMDAPAFPIGNQEIRRGATGFKSTTHPRIDHTAS